MPGNKKSTNRLDLELVKRGICESRQKAQGLILAGKVKVNSSSISKAGFAVRDSDVLEIAQLDEFVSRGGIKLKDALEKTANLKSWIKGKIVADFGASTGGFTDCLLRNHALQVYAFDVGYGQLHPKLSNDQRVKVFDRINIRLLEKDFFQNLADPEFFTADLSFISLKKILPVIKGIFQNIPGLVLVKPQFELPPSKNSLGVVKKWSDRIEAVCNVAESALENGWLIGKILSSCILGPKGNQEFWLFLLNGELQDQFGDRLDPVRDLAGVLRQTENLSAMDAVKI